MNVRIGTDISADVKSNGSRMQLMVDRQHFDGEDWEELMGKVKIDNSS